MQIVRTIVSTLGARLFSATLSFAVFAGVAAALPAQSAARVLFFSFAFGFSLATLRTFHLLAAGVTGRESRSERLRRIQRAACTLRRLSLVCAPLIAGLLWTQGLGWPVAIGGLLLVLACGHDLDLPRAVAGRAPLLPWLTACGGVLGAGLLLVSGTLDESSAALAFMLQWVPVAAYTALYGRRLLGTRQRSQSAPGPGRQVVAGSLLLAMFDGAVNNAPFIFSLKFDAMDAVDMALGSRLYVASLALFALVASWVVAGNLQRWSRRVRIEVPTLFGLLQFSCAVLIGLGYAVLYQMLVGQPLRLSALGIFGVLLAANVFNATAVRFADVGDSAGTVGAYVIALIAYCLFILQLKLIGTASSAEVITAAALALVAPGIFAFWRSARGNKAG